MPFGLVISLLCHAALIGWAYLSMRSVSELPAEDTPAISAEVISPSEFLRLKQGSEDAKQLETKAKEEPKPDESKNDTKKPDNAPPPPPPPAQEIAKAEEPAPPEPPKPAEPDPIAQKIEEPPPPPEPAPGPAPDEQKLLEQKLEEDRLKAEAEAQKKAEEEAKKKAEEEAKKKAEEAKKKKAEELKKKKLAEAKKKAEEAKKKFDPNKIANLLNQAPDDSHKALMDKDPTKKGQQAAGTSQTATATGREAGTATGTDTVLSAREVDLLKGMIKARLAECWRLPGGGGGTEVPVVELRWRLRPDGMLDGDPSVQSAPSDVSGQVAAETALRAVKACQPYLLPPEKYDAWKDIIWVFDPRQML